MHNVGVFFPKFFNDKNYFDLIQNEHKFQSLGLSTKIGTAYREGIYLTHVEKSDNNDDLKFKLLRCSSNLDGSTDNFRKTDHEIINKVNTTKNLFFHNGADLNHVLAQIYHNSILNGKSKKAKISIHSDKTKDMPDNGLITFCTFYKSENPFKNNDAIYTKLRFELKDEVKDSNLIRKFDITLYPNSMFIMPLSSNRLYTHEIIPSILSVDQIPTRMGYVIRCSNTDAIFSDNQTFIIKDKQKIKLDAPTDQGICDLKQLYFIENTTTKKVDYSNFYFSLNNGDYLKPMI
jgi:hypothetical protein